MDPIVGGALIGGAATLLGGHLAGRDNAEANAANAAMQERFAKEGIRWKVQDALAAGVAPEFALGAVTHSPSPTYTPSPRGSMIAEAGQNVARAVMASSTAEDRAFDKAMKLETLRGMKLENDLRSTQLSPVSRPSNPAFPSTRGNVIPGQGNSPVKDVSLERTGMSPSSPHSEGGAIPSVGWSMTQDGGLRPVPSQDIKNRIEDQIIPETTWAIQNLIAPNFKRGPKPPPEGLPKGFHWRWSVSRQAYYPSKGKRNFGDTAWEFYEKHFYNKRFLSGRKYHK